MSRRGRARLVAALCGFALNFTTGFAADSGQPGSSRDAVLQALARVESCRNSLVPDIDVGFDRIASRCPDLAKLLDQAQLAAWLPASWKRSGNDLTARGLGELSTLLNAELARSVLRTAPSTASLAGILTKVDALPAASGWWARFREWLRHELQPEGDTRENPHLLQRLKLSPAVLARCIVGGAVLCVLLALVVIGNELRSAGVMRRAGWKGRRNLTGPRAKQPGRDTRDAFVRLEDLDRAPLLDRPAVLLTIAAQRLGRLPGRSGMALTARELQKALDTEGVESTRGNQATFDRLIDVAEAIRFAEEPPRDSAIAEVVERGRSIIRDAAA